MAWKLDDIFKGEKFDFIQIDVVGYEPKAYRGMKNIIGGTYITTFTPELIRAAGESPEQYRKELERDFKSVEEISCGSHIKLWARK